VEDVSDKYSYIFFKDSKVVLFYPNDLSATPSQPIMDGESVEMVACMHGLGKLAR